ncbi:hypothetical protein [Spirochaeta africana]|uniref:Ribbon-helix-helix protein, copG family n=1 Tax=Spirochaeta africana (strain ATCC 700263 / DSM 8902 / Z-7692) TaxID=889378 RepID=H9UG95_SPIAZ|nr:hypothetical protein [Spirochaeta africana]AFG36538.1 hypothetical protein Spiaf_0434 [Spirochaeta africana DSM 8902]
MSSITIHAIDDVLNARLTQESRRQKKSKNQLIKELLAREMGLPTEQGYADDYREFCGLWTAEEAQQFTAAQGENRTVNPEDWQE